MKRKYFDTKQAAVKTKNKRSKNGEQGLHVFKMPKDQEKMENLSYALRLNI